MQKSQIRRKKAYPEKDTPIPTPPPSNSTATKKQREVLVLLSQGKNISAMARKLGGINWSSVKDRMKALLRKELIFQQGLGSYSLTRTGKLELKGVGVGVGVSPKKSRHRNEFTVDIFTLPKQWTHGHFFIQSLTAKNYFHNHSSKQWYIYFDDCTVRISYHAKRLTFFIKEQVGYSYDELSSKAWDLFVKYHKLISHHGFKLGNHITSKDPHLADPDGFFAKLASLCKIDKFRIDTEDGAFWIDFSLDHIEEESDSETIAKRMEVISESALNTDVSFYDLTELKDIVKDLVRIHVLQVTPHQPIKRAMTEVTYIG